MLHHGERGVQPRDMLIIDAFHPDETPAGERCDALYRLLQADPIYGIAGKAEAIIGNQAAYYAPADENGINRRFLETNMAMAEPDLNGDSEQRRHYHLLHTEFPGRSLVLDRHGNRKNFDWAFCHPAASDLVWRTIGMLGIAKVLHYAAPHPASYAPTYLGLDLHPGSPLTAPVLRAMLQRLADGYTPPLPVSVQRYADVYDISLAEAQFFGLPSTYEAERVLPERVIRGLAL